VLFFGIFLLFFGLFFVGPFPLGKFSADALDHNGQIAWPQEYSDEVPHAYYQCITVHIEAYRSNAMFKCDILLFILTFKSGAVVETLKIKKKQQRNATEF